MPCAGVLTDREAPRANAHTTAPAGSACRLTRFVEAAMDRLQTAQAWTDAQGRRDMLAHLRSKSAMVGFLHNTTWPATSFCVQAQTGRCCSSPGAATVLPSQRSLPTAHTSTDLAPPAGWGVAGPCPRFLARERHWHRVYGRIREARVKFLCQKLDPGWIISRRRLARCCKQSCGFGTGSGKVTGAVTGFKRVEQSKM